MYAQVEKPKENKSKAVANSATQKKGHVKQDIGFVDNRSIGLRQKKIIEHSKFSGNIQYPTMRKIAIQRMSLKDFIEWQGYWDKNSIEALIQEGEEEKIGHAFINHLNIGAIELIERVDKGETDGQAATRFEDDPSKMIADILNEHSEAIKNWANKLGGLPRLVKEFDKVKVLVWEQSSTSSKGRFVTHYGKIQVFVFLTRIKSGIANQPDQFHIKTAFPKLIDISVLKKNTRKGEKKKRSKEKKHMGNSAKKHMKKEKKKMKKKLMNESQLL